MRGGLVDYKGYFLMALFHFILMTTDFIQIIPLIKRFLGF